MRWIGLAAGLALVLAGCGGGSGYQWGAPHGGGKGLPQVRMSASQAMIVPPGRDGELALALRAFVPGPDGWQEAAGAQCSVTGGDYFRAQVVTPVRLVLPDLGPDAPVIAAECVSGTARGRAAVAPNFSWPAEATPRRPSGPGGAAAGGTASRSRGRCATPTSRSACADHAPLLLPAPARALCLRAAGLTGLAAAAGACGEGYQRRRRSLAGTIATTTSSASGAGTTSTATAAATSSTAAGARTC